MNQGFYAIFEPPSLACFSLSIMFTAFISRLVFACSLLAVSVHAYSREDARFDIAPLTAGMHLIKAEVAATESQRRQGLMRRQKMGANEGMVFVFNDAAEVCMWMKDTYIPLSVAFIDTEGRIVNIEDMEPQKLDSHCAKKPVAYALEMNQGWFRQKNIKPGMQIGGLPPLK